MYEHINEYVNPKYYDELCQKEREAETQKERELDSIADDIEISDEDPLPYFKDMSKKYGMTDAEFMRAMRERDVYIGEWQLNPKKFDYEINEKYIPVEWIAERFWKGETGQEEMNGYTRDYLRQTMNDWLRFVKEKKGED